jgi:hypothetical protein
MLTYVCCGNEAQQGEFTMKKMITAVVFASAVALSGVALADTGGVPNDNASQVNLKFGA